MDRYITVVRKPNRTWLRDDGTSQDADVIRYDTLKHEYVYGDDDSYSLDTYDKANKKI